jgi:hypothetical protein
MTARKDDTTRESVQAAWIVITILTLISTWYVYLNVIQLNPDMRINLTKQILSGEAEPPYQYRIFKPLAAKIIETALTPLLYDNKYVSKPVLVGHVVSYGLLSLAAFFGIYTLLYLFLRTLFSRSSTALMGILLFQAVVPLSIQHGFYMEGDFITVFFYLLGLILMLSRKDAYLPLVIGIATFNREQTIFLVVLYVIYLASQKRLLEKGSLIIVAACVAAFLIVFLGVRAYFGFRESRYTTGWIVSQNTSIEQLNYIIPLWLAEVFGLAVLCLMAFRKSNTFFKVSFLSLGLYTLLFFLTGSMDELAKFLPAYLILIPMALQTITGEYVGKGMEHTAQKDSP